MNMQYYVALIFSFMEKNSSIKKQLMNAVYNRSRNNTLMVSMLGTDFNLADQSEVLCGTSSNPRDIYVFLRFNLTLA